MRDKITKVPFMWNDERYFLLFFSEINGYSFIPLPSLCGYFCLSLSNCSLNHSAMGFRES